MNINYVTEARLITSYLLSKPLLSEEEVQYIRAMDVLDLQLSDFESALVCYMFKSTFRLSCIDAGLAIIDPSNQARRKIFTMLAILEASPNYTEYFLSKDFSIIGCFKVFFAGIRAVLRTVLGVLMVKKIQGKCR